MSKPKLLLADDSVTIQKVVNLTFADEGVEVITVGDGDSAMEKIAQIAPDIVLADVHMPGLNGYQICELVRENPVTRDLPVVLLVGSFEPFDEGEAERVGANAFMTKPFQSIRQLVSQVSDLMEARPSRGEPTAGEPDSSEGTHGFHETDPTLEVEAERAAAAGAAEGGGDDGPDTSDIVSLYERSVSGPKAYSEESDQPEAGEADGAEQSRVPYVDAGMDDEMIVARRGDEPEAATVSGDAKYETEEYEAFGTEPEYAGSPDEPAADTGSEPGGPSPFDSLAAATENDASVLESQTEESYFDQFADTEQIAASEVADFELDEIELLELPPLDNGKTIEFTTTQSMIAQGENKQVVSLSPELMDVIVQKVVEKLSEKY